MGERVQTLGGVAIADPRHVAEVTKIKRPPNGVEVEVNLSGIEESEKTITADGYPITLNIMRPEGVKGTLPVFIFIHGGGWVLGDYPTHKRMVRDLVVLSGFAAVFVNYTRTPDARYPQAINEIYQFGDKRFLTVPTIKWMYNMYIAEPEKRQDIYASPLQATVEQLKGLPRALIQVGESDILRDEGEAYGRKLDAAGVKVTTVRYNGMIHDFGLLNGLAEVPAVQSLFVQAAAELKKYLQ